MARYKLFDIVYDIDEDDVEGLPTELTFDVDDDIDVALDGADLITDETGWCVESFNYQLCD